MATRRHEEQVTFYSERIDGSEGNYNWAVTFDKTRPLAYVHEDYFIGITQNKDRVLLTMAQVLELIRFAQKTHVTEEERKSWQKRKQS